MIQNFLYSPLVLQRLFSAHPAPAAVQSGFRLGAIGTHTSRTMMLAELGVIFDAVPQEASRRDYASAIIEGNCLRKSTASTGRLTNQRLGELYGLDRSRPMFRILRRLWDLDSDGRPLIALLCAIARDPLLAATVQVILALPAGAELNRDEIRAALREAVADRLKDSILDKVGRNVASTWTQSGHFEGRTFKRRRLVTATPASIAYALYLGSLVGFRGQDLLHSAWIAVLDCTPIRAESLAVEAKRVGLIDLRVGGGVFDLNLDRLDPFWTE